jgi:outer membrane protein TolC
MNAMRNRTRLTQHSLWGLLLAAGILAGTCAGARAGQQQEPAAAPAPPNPGVQPQGGATAATPLRLSLQEALERARKNSTQFQAAATDSAIAHEDRTQARDALLPTASYNLQSLYSPASGTASGVRFIAANGVHEYLSQGNVHQVLDLATFASFRRASAAAAAARARKEIASRGLVVTVVQGYYAVAAAQQKLEAARKTAEEGDRFLKLTQDLERGGEVAHYDVMKAELQMQDRRRQLQEAQLALLNARLDLAVLLFPDFNDNYEVADDLHAAVSLPTLAEVQQLAARDNPDVRAALASLQAAGHDVTGARAGYLPSLSFDYFYGIDAAQFAAKDPAGNSNLGSAATATLSLPLWNWGATQSRIKQAELRRTQAQRELSLAQRKLLAEIRSLYAEAETSLNELSGLNRSAVLAGDSLQLTMLRYKGGEATVLEVVDAQTTYSQANFAYQDGAVRYRVALANLQTLTGVLTSP